MDLHPIFKVGGCSCTQGLFNFANDAQTNSGSVRFLLIIALISNIVGLGMHALRSLTLLSAK